MNNAKSFTNISCFIKAFNSNINHRPSSLITKVMKKYVWVTIKKTIKKRPFQQRNSCTGFKTFIRLGIFILNSLTLRQQILKTAKTLRYCYE